ncbi:MAG: hypothetical protein CEN88_181 [Candidatus Berkelbacteria bacterium Licking1014_2]|uniref:Fido domain-containing protein n=1 Tax=Candidatus Berkelbacteria bacterium Licking1014_2 TaxID=2017146 RepID=A0A554LW68_9BACT|nr:MAG: hypothetical protein CEN88_181 [Candidatus Berkelbacteria bacterium Licking1014_2]
MDLNLINKRQEKILNYLGQNNQAAVSDLLFFLDKKYSKITIIRDLNFLINLNFVIRQGRGRAITYQLSPQYDLIRPIDVHDYFAIEADKREINKRFNFNIWGKLKGIFTEQEKSHLYQLANDYQKNIKKLPPAVIKREMERLIIEFSWKSSAIEGNTYTLLETEALIKMGKEAKGHKKEEAIMILNHKKALEYIIKNADLFGKINVVKIEYIHRLLTERLGIERNLRKHPVGIAGTKYRPLDNIYQIKESLTAACRIVNKEKDVFAKAIILMILIAYIQPFADGNKRAGRLLANAILLANDFCPLSYRNVDEIEYKKAVVLFYEKNNISYFKKLFIEQFEFAVKNYF